MSLCETLAGPVRREMNHIFTERPFNTPSGADFGWYCREHAVSLAALLACLGYPANICMGDVFLRVPGEVVLSTIGTGADHAWCTSGNVAPIDLSVTLRYLAVSCADVDLVCSGCDGCLAGFRIRYLQGISDAAFMEAANTGEKIIAYNEKNRIGRSIGDLLMDPFKFLHPPPTGMPNLLDLYGSNVLFAVTVHLLKLARAEIKPLFTYQSPSDALRTMVNRHPNARQLVLEAMGNAAT